jgi:FHS family L-fucose permease-like MFS transporter
LTDIEKHNLETYRMKWLLGALAVVVITLLFSNLRAQKKPEGWGAMRYPQLVLGMLGIFVYVGVEVTIVSNFSELLKQPDFGGYHSSQVAPFISMYWGSLMIGRWTGSIPVFNLRSQRSRYSCSSYTCGFWNCDRHQRRIAIRRTTLYYYIVCVFVQMLAFYLSKSKPARTLMIFALLGLLAMLIGLFSKGQIAVYAFLSGGLFAPSCGRAFSICRSSVLEIYTHRVLHF